MSKSSGTKKMHWSLWVLFFVLGIALFGGLVFLNLANQRKNDLAELILAHPNTTAVAAYTVDENGQPVADGSEVFLNADTPLVLASTMKTVVAAAYESAVELGELDRDEMVEIADLEQFYLPKTDGGAHAAALAKLGLAADGDGFARDQTAKVRLDDIARIVIHNSGNAETDYLLSRLTEERIAATLKAGGFENHSPFHSLLGISLAMMNHKAPLTDAARRQALVAEVESGNYRTLENLADLYLHNPEWRSAQLAFMRSEAFLEAANQMGWDGQVEAGRLFPKGTAREYAGLMAQIATGKFISPAVSARLQDKLETASADDPMRLLFHQRYGGKDGVTAGVLSLVSYAEPKSGPLAGKVRVVVILTNNLSYSAWSQMLNFQSIYLLQSDLAKRGWQ